MLHHLPKPVRSAFAEARRVLKPGGRLLLIDSQAPAAFRLPRLHRHAMPTWTDRRAAARADSRSRYRCGRNKDLTISARKLERPACRVRGASAKRTAPGAPPRHAAAIAEQVRFVSSGNEDRLRPGVVSADRERHWWPTLLRSSLTSFLGKPMMRSRRGFENRSIEADSCWTGATAEKRAPATAF